MNATLSLEVTGIDQICRELSRRLDLFRVNGTAEMDQSGIGMMEQVSELSPYDTGFMSSHVTYTPLSGAGSQGYGPFAGAGTIGFTVGWHADEFHAAGHPFYPVLQELGTIHHAAQPSLGPVGRQALPELEKDMGTVMLRSFR